MPLPGSHSLPLRGSHGSHGSQGHAPRGSLGGSRDPRPPPLTAHDITSHRPSSSDGPRINLYEEDDNPRDPGTTRVFQIPSTHKKHDDMGEWVDTFIRRLSRTFVPIRLTTSRPAVGTFERLTWASSEEHPLDAWTPEKAGTMYLHGYGIECMVKLDQHKQQQAYDALLVHAALTVAHELMHCFVGMLGKNAHCHTPRPVAEGFDFDLNGGILKPYKDKNDLLGVLQRGEMWIVRDGGSAERVDPECIREIAEGGPDFKHQFPLKVIGPGRGR
ncbi:hypothetical protein VTK56DRAFT_5196 [Thermocarpiscus australiensis]